MPLDEYHPALGDTVAIHGRVSRVNSAGTVNVILDDGSGTAWDIRYVRPVPEEYEDGDMVLSGNIMFVRARGGWHLGAPTGRLVPDNEVQKPLVRLVKKENA